jgi:hypothetical protein
MRRAVPIDAGTHRVQWRYATPGLSLGAIAAAIGCLGLAALWLATRRYG